MTVGAIELGGSHVSAAVVAPDACEVERETRIPLAAGDPREELLGAILAAASTLCGVERLGVAVPGPFDYEHGICTIRGLGKLESLYGLDLRREFAVALDVEPSAIVFLNDAEAFLLGEAVAGAARVHDRAIGITLGTGLGSAFLARGELVRDDPMVPPRGELHVVPFKGAPVEDAISGRGVAARGGASAAELAARADAGDAAAAAVFGAVGADLSQFLEPWLAAFRPDCIVVGGSIARAWQHLAPSLPPIAVPAERLDEAALLGAAQWAAREARPLSSSRRSTTRVRNLD